MEFGICGTANSDQLNGKAVQANKVQWRKSMQPYDRSSKWLLEHYGASLLRLAGVADVESCRALTAEVVQPRQLADGLLEVRLRGSETPDLFIVEIATYPERRVIEQVMRDAMLVWLDRRILPEVLTLVLSPKGVYRVPGQEALSSRLGWTALGMNWRVVELWNMPAEPLLTAGDVGLLPWVPLMQSETPPEQLLTRCRQLIDERAAADERPNLLAVMQVLMRLRYNDPRLFAIFGGSQGMIESPLIQELLAGRMHRAILKVLAGRFGPVPQEITTALHAIQDDAKLDELIVWAGNCPDLESFRSRLA